MNNKININDYQKLIYKIISKFPSEYRSELFNECYIQLESLSKRYTEAKGKFETFAYQRLYYCCVDFINDNRLNKESLDEMISIDGEDVTAKIDLLESDIDVESDFILKDYLHHHNNNLTEVEKFIQSKYYQDGVSVATIIKVYQPFHQIRSEATIYKILKK